MKKQKQNSDIRDIFFEELTKRAIKDTSIVLLTCDMGAEGLKKYKESCPDRYFNIGIMEQTGINAAAGLAIQKFKPVVYGIAAFMTYRGFEQIKLNMGDMSLPITVIGSGPGLNYKSDGPTHHAIYDLPILSLIPQILILTPYNIEEAVKAVSYIGTQPLYIRLGKGKYPRVYGCYEDKYADCPFMIGGKSGY